jgi:hypothetical protein
MVLEEAGITIGREFFLLHNETGLQTYSQKPTQTTEV